MKKLLYQIMAAVMVATFALPALSKVTLDDVYAADAPKRARDLANNAAHMARHSRPIEPSRSDSSSDGGGWKTLYSGNTVSPITIPSGVANLYVTTTTGQSYFIPVVAPPSNFAKLQGDWGGYVYARWTGHQIKGESKTVTTSEYHLGDRHHNGYYTHPTYSKRIGITRIMTQ
uniref:Uncharacterized protein n=1 Tax=Vibrio tasmaniensis TaxID=212663 RepID=A0A0H4A1B3_9VIBR|nr:hypothetical protein [Vibrio tasmaniensis]AKN40722.1 hypothetical protein [Vibrio tasmaniensis]